MNLIVELRKRPKSIVPHILAGYEREHPYLACVWPEGIVVYLRAGLAVPMCAATFERWFRIPKYMKLLRKNKNDKIKGILKRTKTFRERNASAQTGVLERKSKKCRIP